MDIFKYPHPAAKMTVEMGNMDSPKASHEKNILGHHFNHAVSVIFPTALQVEDTPFDDDQDYYIARKVPLQKFINEEFIGAFVKKGSFYAMTSSTRIDVDNCVALIPPGFLVMSLDKDTYESLGLQGERSQFYKSNAQKFTVKLDMTAKSFVPGRKLYDRAAKMLATLPLLDFLFTWVPHDKKISSLSVKAYVDTWGVQTETCSPKEWFSTGRSVPVPNISSLVWNGDDSNWNHTEFFEWLGSFACGINCPTLDDLDDGMSTFACHAPYKNVDLIAAAQWNGLIPPQNIYNLFQKLRNRVTQHHAGIPWVAMLVHGFSDSIFSWEKNEHGFEMDGDNLYCYVMFADSQYWMYKCLGKNSIMQ